MKKSDIEMVAKLAEQKSSQWEDLMELAIEIRGDTEKLLLGLPDKEVDRIVDRVVHDAIANMRFAFTRGYEDAFVDGMFHLLAIAHGKKITVDIGKPDEVFNVDVVQIKDLEAIFMDGEDEKESKK